MVRGLECAEVHGAKTANPFKLSGKICLVVKTYRPGHFGNRPVRVLNKMASFLKARFIYHALITFSAVSQTTGKRARRVVRQ